MCKKVALKLIAVNAEKITNFEINSCHNLSHKSVVEMANNLNCDCGFHTAFGSVFICLLN